MGVSWGVLGARSCCSPCSWHPPWCRHRCAALAGPVAQGTFPFLFPTKVLPASSSEWRLKAPGGWAAAPALREGKRKEEKVFSQVPAGIRDVPPGRIAEPLPPAWLCLSQTLGAATDRLPLPPRAGSHGSITMTAPEAAKRTVLKKKILKKKEFSREMNSVANCNAQRIGCAAVLRLWGHLPRCLAGVSPSATRFPWEKNPQALLLNIQDRALSV